MIMIVKTPGSQMGSPAAAEEGGEEMGGEKCESGERSEVRGRGENLCFRFGGTKYLKIRNTEANWANREIPWRLK